MKIKIYKISMVFFSLILLESCALFNKKINVENVNIKEERSVSEVVKEVRDKDISPKSISLNGKIRIQDRGTRKLNAAIIVKKDSIIWISIKASLGIEVLRAVITRDSVYYLSRMEKKYFVKHISHLEDITGKKISYNEAQDILFGSPKITDQQYFLNQNHSKIVLESVTKSYTINPVTFRVERVELIGPSFNRVIIGFGDQREMKKHSYPEEISVEIKSNESFKATLNFSKIEFDKKTKTSFKIPKSYVRMD